MGYGIKPEGWLCTEVRNAEEGRAVIVTGISNHALLARIFPDCQGPLIEGFGFRVLALVGIERRQVVEAPG
jgi:hypothetical protein